MNNPDQHKAAPMNPRISFSMDFVESHRYQQQQQRQTTLESDRSDFEFSVSNDSLHSTAAADELFFKGRILPLKDPHFPKPTTSTATANTTTLRDELQLASGVDPKPSFKGKWKGLLGLRKSHIDPSRKQDSPAPKRAACSGTNNGFSFPP